MSEEKTLPVILIGVDPIEAKGFNKVSVKVEGEYLFCHQGAFNVHMEGETLVIQFKPLHLEKGKSPDPS